MTPDRLAAALVLAASVALLAMLPAWRTEEPSAAFSEAATDFLARVESFADAHATGREVDGRPVVAPPPGDVPLVARRFEFWPALELREGQTYRLLLSSADTVHSAVLDGREVLLVPGQVQALTVTPSRPGRLELRCNEYCGIGHARMHGTLLVEPQGMASNAR